MTTPAALLLERLPDRLRLYLGGDLQFDTADEAIYHERLAHPALLAARARSAGPLDVLVLGGGDGLLVRELLRHDAVRSIRVVDLNPDVVALARSELRPFNAASLDDPRVEVVVADARADLEGCGLFHAIVSDLTFPTTADDCALLTRDWFARLREHLHPGGVLALNGVSPERTPAAFWCLYQTLRAAGLVALPGQYHLPSFAELGYGRWGLFLASDRLIEEAELLATSLPAGVATLGAEALAACFRFPESWAEERVAARPACDGGRTLFEALLDARPAPAIFLEGEAPSGPPGGCGPDGASPSQDRRAAMVRTLSFLGFADPVPPPEPAAPGAVSPRLREWLDRQPASGIDDLLTAVPLSHRIVTRRLVREWSAHLVQVAATLDLRRLVVALLRRAAVLPRRLVEELRRFRRRLARGDRPAEHLTTWGWRFFSVLMLVLVLSQTALPTAAYAKGFSSFHSYPSSSHRYHSGASTLTEEEKEQMRRMFGVVLFGGGAVATGVAAKRIHDRKSEES